MITACDLPSLETKVRDIIGEATARNFTQAHIFRAINAEYAKMCREVLESDTNYFDTTKTYTLTSATNELPKNTWKIREFLVYRDDRWFPVQPINTSNYWLYTQSDNSPKQAKAIRFEGDNIILEPGYSNVTQLKIFYSRVPAELVYGVAAAGAATTITLTGTSIYDDIYIGDEIVITSGTGVGQTKTITDYVGSTKVATVSTWTTNPDTTSYYSTVPGNPVNRFDAVLTMGAAIRLFPWRRDSEMQSVMSAQYQEEYARFQLALAQRQTAEPRYGNFILREDDF